MEIKKLLINIPSCPVLTEHYNCTEVRICHAKAVSAALSSIQNCRSVRMRILRLKVRKTHAKEGRVGRRPDWLDT